MSLIDTLHGGYVFGRRVRVLTEHLAAALPPKASVLDVGCGDGLLASCIMARRPDIQIHGIDVLIRPEVKIPVERFDGTTIPHADGSYDVVMFVDVLHHTPDPSVLLREARRVARQAVVLKDHTRDGLLANTTLAFMDWVGNARHGVSLPYNYWSRRQWHDAFAAIGLQPKRWEPSLGLYPFWANWLFGRSLHFVAVLDVKAPAA